jgi:hypothetical protein
MPVHELVQPAVSPYDGGAGTQQQMKGVAQDDLRAVCGDFFRRNRLDRAVGPDGHEGRRANRTAP